MFKVIIISRCRRHTLEAGHVEESRASQDCQQAAACGEREANANEDCAHEGRRERRGSF
jgi:hypothetical protein